MKLKKSLLKTFLIIYAGVACSCTPSLVAVKPNLEIPEACQEEKQPKLDFKEVGGQFCLVKGDLIDLYTHFKMRQECDEIIRELIK